MRQFLESVLGSPVGAWSSLIVGIVILLGAIVGVIALLEERRAKVAAGAPLDQNWKGAMIGVGLSVALIVLGSSGLYEQAQKQEYERGEKSDEQRRAIEDALRKSTTPSLIRVK